MVDGGNCLVDESMPVNGVHYLESFWRDYPGRGLHAGQGLTRHIEGRHRLGQGALAAGARPADLHGRDRTSSAATIRPPSPSSPARAASPAGGRPRSRGPGCWPRCWPRATAGTAWPPTTSGSAPRTPRLHYNSWKPVCVLCRQWNWTFGGGSTVDANAEGLQRHPLRRPHRDGLGTAVGRQSGRPGEKKTFQLGPGQARGVHGLRSSVPTVAKRTAGQFILTCSRGGKEVFREVKHGGGARSRTAGRSRRSTAGRTGRHRPAGRGQGPAGGRAASPSRRPRASTTCRPRRRVVVVGKDALSAREATDPRWLALAARGAGCWCWSRSNPLHYLALPADLVADRLRRPRGLHREPRASRLRRPGPGRLLHLVEATTSSTATSTRRPRAAPSRWPIATSSSAARPSPSARSTTA